MSDNRYRECPSDGLILDFYQNVYETVYIVLHPFYYSKTIDFKSIADENWPTDLDLLLNCEAVAWKDVVSLGKFKDISEIDHGLRTSMGGLKKTLENKILAERINALFVDDGLLSPDCNGLISPFIFKNIMTSIQQLGYQDVMLIDEFCFESPQLRNINLLLDKLDIERGSYYLSHKNLLVTTHWDSHCSFICGSKKLVNQFVELSGLEGFFCTAQTHVYWGIHRI